MRTFAKWLAVAAVAPLAGAALRCGPAAEGPVGSAAAPKAAAAVPGGKMPYVYTRWEHLTVDDGVQTIPRLLKGGLEWRCVPGDPIGL